MVERRVVTGGKHLQVDVAANVWQATVTIVLATGDSAAERCRAKAKAARGSKLKVGNKELKDSSTGFPC